MSSFFHSFSNMSENCLLQLQEPGRTGCVSKRCREAAALTHMEVPEHGSCPYLGILYILLLRFSQTGAEWPEF